METRDRNQETEPAIFSMNNAAIAPMTPSPTQGQGEPRLYNFQNNTMYHVEPMNYVGSGYDHNPVPYRPGLIFPHPTGCPANGPQFYSGGSMGNAATVMLNRTQFNSVHQQAFHRNPISIRQVQTGNLYYPEQLYGSLPQPNSNYIFPGHSMDSQVASSNENLFGGFLNPGYVHGWHGMNVNPGIMHGPYPRANSISLNFPVPQGHPHHYLPVPDARALSLGHHLDAGHINEALGPVAGLSHMDQVRFSRMGLNNSLTRTPHQQDSFQPQHSHENIVRTLPIGPYPFPPADGARRSTNMVNPSGVPGQAHWSRPNHFNQTPPPFVRRNVNPMASASHQVSQRKTLTRRSYRRRKPFNEDVYHISWDGFDKVQPIGVNCNLCKKDVTRAPGNKVDSPTFLPSVSILPCGHVFHTECFQLRVPDQSAAPPCYLCAI